MVLGSFQAHADGLPKDTGPILFSAKVLGTAGLSYTGPQPELTPELVQKLATEAEERARATCVRLLGKADVFERTRKNDFSSSIQSIGPSNVLPAREG